MEEGPSSTETLVVTIIAVSSLIGVMIGFFMFAYFCECSCF